MQTGGQISDQGSESEKRKEREQAMLKAERRRDGRRKDGETGFKRGARERGAIGGEKRRIKEERERSEVAGG